MKKTTLLLTVIAVFAAWNCSGDAKKKETTLSLAQESFQLSMPGMAKEVTTYMETKGVAETVVYCQSFSPEYMSGKEKELIKLFAEKHNLQAVSIGRASLKTRNSSNTPDETQKQILDAWAQSEQAGTKASPTVVGKGKEYTAMIPIRIAGEACLKCHGPAETLDEEVKTILAETYPQDKAVGYSLGELRGAFYFKALYR